MSLGEGFVDGVAVKGLLHWIYTLPSAGDLSLCMECLSHLCAVLDTSLTIWLACNEHPSAVKVKVRREDGQLTLITPDSPSPAYQASIPRSRLRLLARLQVIL